MTWEGKIKNQRNMASKSIDTDTTERRSETKKEEMAKGKRSPHAPSSYEAPVLRDEDALGLYYQ